MAKQMLVTRSKGEPRMNLHNRKLWYVLAVVFILSWIAIEVF